MANGIAFVFLRIKPPPGSRIIAQTDCQTVINILEHGHSMNPEAELVQRLLTEGQVQIEYRHVHRGNATPRHAVNTWCDKECYRLLKIARKAVQTKMIL